MRSAAAIGTEIAGWKEVFVATIAVRPHEVVSLRYASPESGRLRCHLSPRKYVDQSRSA
jgi:hypothetical protein